MIAMQDIRVHQFTEGPVVTALLAPGEYVAFEQDNELVRGLGDTWISAIADLNRAIEAAGADRDEGDDRPLTGQNLQDCKWDHARDSRKHEVA